MSVRLVKNDYGRMRIWREPRENRRYVIGADVAEGISRVDDSHAGVADRDYSASCVLDVDTGNLDAAWYGRLPSNEFADILDMIGNLYNEALLAVEVNNQGISTVHSLEAAGYPNLYLPMVAKHAVVHEYIGLKNKGWVTSRTTKPLLIDAIRETLAGSADIPWMLLLKQLESMEINPKTGSAQAPYGMHDDAVMAFGIAECVRLEALIGGEGDYKDGLNTTLDPDSRKIFRILRKMQDQGDDDYE